MNMQDWLIETIEAGSARCHARIACRLQVGAGG